MALASNTTSNLNNFSIKNKKIISFKNFLYELISSNDNNEEASSRLKYSCISDVKRNILVIDDESLVLMTMRIMLGFNYNVITTTSAKDALKFIRRHHKRIDLILLDLMMPETYGLNVLNEIKHDQTLKNIPVIIQSATNDDIEINKAKKKAEGFISKPFKKKDLLEFIESKLK